MEKGSLWHWPVALVVSEPTGHAGCPEGLLGREPGGGLSVSASPEGPTQ